MLVDTVVRKTTRLVEVSLGSTPAYLGAKVVAIESEPVGEPSMSLDERFREVSPRCRLWRGDSWGYDRRSVR